MKTTALLLVTFAAFVTSAKAYVTNSQGFDGCNEEYCDDIVCDSVVPSDCYRVEENGSACGCCDLCIHAVESGEYCPPFTYDVRYPRTHECREGFFCNPVSNSCESIDYWYG